MTDNRSDIQRNYGYPKQLPDCTDPNFARGFPCFLSEILNLSYEVPPNWFTWLLFITPRSHAGPNLPLEHIDDQAWDSHSPEPKSAIQRGCLRPKSRQSRVPATRTDEMSSSPESRVTLLVTRAISRFSPWHCPARTPLVENTLGGAAGANRPNSVDFACSTGAKTYTCSYLQQHPSRPVSACPADRKRKRSWVSVAVRYQKVRNEHDLSARR